MEASDEQLMLAYQGGDAGAFETLYARHRGALFRFMLRSIKERGTAEELFQEVWMRVIEARVRYAPQARFTTWLYTIAHHRMVDHWRRRGLTVYTQDVFLTTYACGRNSSWWIVTLPLIRNSRTFCTAVITTPTSGPKTSGRKTCA